MILDEKHQKVAIEIVKRNRSKKSCNKCYDRGYIGFSADKTIVPCEKCVDTGKAYEEWKAYVATDEQLKEEYKEIFEEETEEEVEETKEEKVSAKPVTPAQSVSKSTKTVSSKPQMQRRSQGK